MHSKTKAYEKSRKIAGLHPKHLESCHLNDLKKTLLGKNHEIIQEEFQKSLERQVESQTQEIIRKYSKEKEKEKEEVKKKYK